MYNKIVKNGCYLLLLFFLCAACGTIATPVPPSDRRAIILEVDNHSAPPVFDPMFDLRVRVNRDYEGIQIWTNEQPFWESGDTVRSLQDDLKIDLSIDNLPINQTPLVFWWNGSIQTVLDENGDPLGSYLSAPMAISFSTANVSVGSHTLRIVVSKPSGLSFEQSWAFRITPRAARHVAPPDSESQAKQLMESPHPLPTFLEKVGESPHYLDDWIGIVSNEGICLNFSDQSPLADRCSQSANWAICIQNHTIVTIDGGIRDAELIAAVGGSDQPGYYMMCLDTDDFAEGLHLAVIQLDVPNISDKYTYSWAFLIE